MSDDTVIGRLLVGPSWLRPECLVTDGECMEIDYEKHGVLVARITVRRDAVEKALKTVTDSAMWASRSLHGLPERVELFEEFHAMLVAVLRGGEAQEMPLTGEALPFSMFS